jgi:heptosyltransferase III
MLSCGGGKNMAVSNNTDSSTSGNGNVNLHSAHILVCRTDNIGDVVLTLPLCGFIKSKLGADSKITFLGKTYTRAVVECCEQVDSFLNWDELKELSFFKLTKVLREKNFTHVVFVFPNKKISFACKAAKIKWRIGTNRRWFHWLCCNIQVSVSRKKSNLHEAQLNAQLFAEAYHLTVPNLLQLTKWGEFQTHSKYVLAESWKKKLPANFSENESLRKIVLVHPKSLGSAREWGLENFQKLAIELKNRGFFVGVTGSKAEGIEIQKHWNFECDKIVLLAGKFSLSEFIQLISCCQTLVAASTGPLHLAASCGIHAVGLYPPMRPIHAERWKPLGKKVSVLTIDKECNDCRAGGKCFCLESIEVNRVADVVSGEQT